MKDPIQENQRHTRQEQIRLGQKSDSKVQSIPHNSPGAIAQRKLQEAINNSPQVQEAAQLQLMIDNSPRQVMQRKEIARLHNNKEEEQPIQAKENKSDLPDKLKTGVESLSGMSMDNVKVHYSSAKPAQLNALAYAQGNDIHLGPGQEKHLPHEAWHVVQQRQGRVNATMQMKSGEEDQGKKPGLSDEDKKKYTYQKAQGDLYVDDSGKAIDAKNSTGDGVELNDVKQGALGNCYFLAAIGAIANSNPASLKQLIKDNGDGTFNVTLYVHNYFFSIDRSPHVEKVSLMFPLDSSGNPAYAKYGDTKELWVMLLEKAFAQYQGGYDEIEGGNLGEAMELLSGGSSNTANPESLTDKVLIWVLKEALKKKKAITASSNKFEGDKKKQQLSKSTGVIGGHAYVVKSIDEAAQTINLYNPWGFSHLPALPIADFKKFIIDFKF